MVGAGAGLLGEKAEYHHQLYDTCLEQVVGGLKISKSVPLFIAKDWIRARAVSTGFDLWGALWQSHFGVGD